MVRFAIIGTGPSGLYLGKYLHNLIQSSKIDFFEKSNTLFGLFSYGIAPDRPSLKASGYSLVNSNSVFRQNWRFFTGVEVGTHLNIDTLLKFYNYIFLCCGAERPKSLPINNEQFGVFNSLDIVKYYNHLGHHHHNSRLPSGLQIYRLNGNSQGLATVESTDNKNNKVVEEYLEHLSSLKEIEIGIIGNGNVSLDIVRAFSSFKHLPTSDNLENKHKVGSEEEVGKKEEKVEINKNFLQILKKLDIKRITLFGRSSLPDSKFTNGELRELLHTKDTKYKINSSDRIGSLVDTTDIDTTSRVIRRKLELFKSLVELDYNISASIPGGNLGGFNNFENSNNIVGSINRDTIIGGRVNKTIEVDFKFNSKVVEAVNDPLGNIIKLKFQYNSGRSVNSEVEERRCNLLVKCVGFEPSELGFKLLNQVDNKNIFANGWLTSGGRGDLNHTITNSVQLAKYIHHLVASTKGDKKSGGSNSSIGGDRDILNYLESKYTVTAR